MALELTLEQIAALAPDSLLAGLRGVETKAAAPTVTLPTTQPIPSSTELPHAPHALPAPLHDETTPRRHTPTYDALRGILAASAAFYGAPNVARVAGGYAVRLGDTLAVGVTITEPLTTLVSWNVRAAETKVWTCLETKRMPKLAPRELLALFVTGKELP